MEHSRRSFIKKSSAAALSVPFIPKTFNIHKGILPKDNLVGQGEFQYKVNKEWGIQDSSKIPVKDCHEMVMDKQGRLLLLTNHTQNNVIIYDRSGKVLKTWGNNFPGAHGLTLVNEGGEEFLWITDQDLHKVFKTTLDGKVLMELGYPKEAGVYEKAEQYLPTETAIGPNGDLYVADGYGLNYIIRYNAKGEYLEHFGGKGESDDQFDCCHGVTLDTRGGKLELLITSRTKQQFKRFTLDGKHLETIDLPGCWICRPVIKRDNLYFAVIVTETWWGYDGMLAILDKSNKVVSYPGGHAPYDDSGSLQKGTSDLKTFLNPHDVCVDNDDNLYVPQWYSGKTYPVMLERV